MYIIMPYMYNMYMHVHIMELHVHDMVYSTLAKEVRLYRKIPSHPEVYITQ